MTPARTLASLLTRPADECRQMGWRGSEAVPWSAFSARARAWQWAFERAPGSRFALFFDDGIEFSAALFGIWQAGKQAWLPGDMTSTTQAALTRHVSGWAGDGAGLAQWPRVVPTNEMAPVAAAPIEPEAENLVVFTSGSTGVPEPCYKHLRQLFDEIDGLEGTFGQASPACTVVASVSAQHVYGLLFRVLWPLATGRLLQARTLVHVEDLDVLVPPAHRAILIASPTHLGRLPLLAPLAAARVQQVFSSGAPLPDAALPETLRVFGQAPFEIYGSTETGGVAWRQRNPGARAWWQAVPRVQWRLDDGQLVIRSPHLPTLDWTPCADRAAAVEDGFELRGRADRVVKVAEKRVSLQAVQDRLLRTGLLADLRLVVFDEPRTQIAVVAVPSEQGWALHDADGRRGLAAALREQLLDVVERVALPRRWRFLAEMPRNPQGKSTLARLKAEFDAGRPTVRALARDSNRLNLTLLIDERLPYFDGHFDGHPILPGVAQVDWALLFGREHFEIQGEFAGADQLKFQRVVEPGSRVVLALEHQASGRLAFRYESLHGVHASGRLLFEQPA